MRQELIFQPMGALAVLTFAVLSIIPFRRVRAGFAKQLSPADFKYGESARVSPHVALPNRNYMNLLELPVLFYVVCLMFYVTSQVSTASLIIAWLFVGSRFVHSAIHLTSNHVIHRLLAFATGNFLLLALWGMFFVQ